jgi:hypothetical protein
MEYIILSKGERIGKVTAPEADFGMGIVFGEFAPFPAYEHVQPVFRKYAQVGGDRRATDQEQLKHYERELEALDLSVTTVTGLPVKTFWVGVIDCSEVMGGEGYWAEFQVPFEFFLDSALWSKKEAYLQYISG